MATLEACDINDCPQFETIETYFTFECMPPKSVRFSCLHNFHHVSGELNSTCINGSWTSPDPIVCEVDFLMQRAVLAPLIAGSTTLVSMLLLAIDFFLYKQDSLKIRMDAARRHWHSGPLKVLVHYNRRQLQYHGKVSRKKLARLKAQLASSKEEIVCPTGRCSVFRHSESMSSSGAVDNPERGSTISEKNVRLKDLKEKELQTKSEIKMYKNRLEMLENDLLALSKEKDVIK